MIEWLRSLFTDEPVLVLSVVQAGIALLVSFGFDFSPVQIGTIVAFSAAILGLIARRKVTPVGTDGAQ